MKTNSPRIALFMPAFSGGGAERVMLTLAEGFLERGLRVDLVVTNARGPLLNEVPSGVSVVNLRASRIAFSIWPLVRYLRRARPETLLSALTPTNIVALIARKLAGVAIRVVVAEHSTLSVSSRHNPIKRGRLLPLFARCLFSNADAIVAVSGGVADDLAKVLRLQRDRIDVIYNPVLTRRFNELSQQPLTDAWFAPGQPPVILSVGRLTAAKDFETLIKAFSIVREKATARLMILGEGEKRDDLQQLIEKLDLQNDVRLPGFVDNPYPYMREAKVFVLSSRWEGFGLVLAEALSCGTPVVSTDCPSGPREILKDGRLGKMVNVGDASAMADAITETLCRKSQTDLYYNRFKDETAIDSYLELCAL